MHFVTHKAHGQDVQVYRVDVDFRNVFNATSQAALWHFMNMFHTPDVDLLEQIHDSTTVRLAANDLESVTTTFDTGVSQGSITSPQLFNIFINALSPSCGWSRWLARIKVSVMVCKLVRTRMTAVKTPSTAIALITYCLVRRSVQVRTTRIFMSENKWGDCLLSTPDTLF